MTNNFILPAAYGQQHRCCFNLFFFFFLMQNTSVLYLTIAWLVLLGLVYLLLHFYVSSRYFVDFNNFASFFFFCWSSFSFTYKLVCRIYHFTFLWQIVIFSWIRMWSINTHHQVKKRKPAAVRVVLSYIYKWKMFKQQKKPTSQGYNLLCMLPSIMMDPEEEKKNFQIAWNAVYFNVK